MFLYTAIATLVIAMLGHACDLCGDGFIEFNDQCYLFDSTPRTFSDSLRFCTRHNSYPLAVDAGVELDFVTALLGHMYKCGEFLFNH